MIEEITNLDIQNRAVKRAGRYTYLKDVPHFNLSIEVLADPANDNFNVSAKKKFIDFPDNRNNYTRTVIGTKNYYFHTEFYFVFNIY